MKNVRLWGKILGSKQDYFIAEGVSDDLGEQPEMPPNVEAKGTGVNKLGYWACKKLFFFIIKIHLFFV